MLPFKVLSDEQILELLAEQPRMLSIPGVSLVWVDYLTPGRSEIAVIVFVYAGEVKETAQLPLTVAGLPVIVKVEDPYTRQVVEVIDPRKNGGAWPRPGATCDRAGEAGSGAKP